MLFFTIWPLFALIALGFFLARAGFPHPEFWPGAERVTYFILFPALLFSSLAKAPLDDPDLLQLGAAGVTVILIATAALWLARRVRPTSAARFGPAVQGVVRFNTYLGFAVVGSVAGDEGIARAAVYLAVGVPLVNLVSILALTEPGAGRRPGALLKTILRNPLILACLAGFAVAVSGTGLPFGTDAFFGLLAQASLPLGLLCVGAALQPAALRRDIGVLAGNAVLRLLGMPVLATLVALAFGLDASAALVLLVFSAVSTAPTAYVLTRQLGGDGAFMAGLVTCQTMLAVVTIPLVLMLLAPG